MYNQYNTSMVECPLCEAKHLGLSATPEAVDELAASVVQK